MECIIVNPNTNEKMVRYDNSIPGLKRNTIGRPKILKKSKYNNPNTVFINSPLLAKSYKDFSGNPTQNVMGWWMSEKYDGYRAIWNGKCFKSRTNNRFSVPKWFSRMMPQGVALDGELWLGRGCFEKCGLFRRKRPKKKTDLKLWEKEWAKLGVIYKVFDLPGSDEPFEKRMNKLKRIIYTQMTSGFDFLDKVVIKTFPLQYVEQIKIETRDQLEDTFRRVVLNGGEGVMLRKPKSFYENCRSETLLKYKLQDDMECKIVGYRMSSVSAKQLGSFKCQLLDKDIIFTVGGINNSVKKGYRRNYKLGTVITIQYNGFTVNGKPRHPRYLRKRFTV